MIAQGCIQIYALLITDRRVQVLCTHEVIIGEARLAGKIRFPADLAFLAGSIQTWDRFRPTTRI